MVIKLSFPRNVAMIKQYLREIKPVSPFDRSYCELKLDRKMWIKIKLFIASLLQYLYTVTNFF